MEEVVQVTGVGVVPGVVLQQVELVRLQTIERALHCCFDSFLRNAARFRYPLGENLDIIFFCMLAGEDAGDVFGRAVVVGHVEGGETCSCIGLHILGGLVEVERLVVALHVGNLPQACDDL